jgi:hypothetical protein
MSLSALEKIASFAAALGPAQQNLPVTVAGVTHDFTFRRVPYITLEGLRLSGFGEDGKFSADKFKGQSARVVAESVINDDGSPVGDFNFWALQDGPVVDAIAKVADKFNGFSPQAAAELGKESGKTDGSVSS